MMISSCPPGIVPHVWNNYSIGKAQHPLTVDRICISFSRKHLYITEKHGEE
jgi:hypothetical protein